MCKVEKNDMIKNMNQKFVVIFFSAVFIVVAGFAVQVFLQNKNGAGEEIACTAEAKLCPDGSAVGRTGPNCEFARCPEEKIEKNISDMGTTGGNEMNAGIIQGSVSIGPICPVERIDMPCKTPPSAYTARTLVIYRADGKTVVAFASINSDGTYSFKLAPGNYILDMKRAGIDFSKNLPRPFTLSVGQIVEADIFIDTGIR